MNIVEEPYAEITIYSIVSSPDWDLLKKME